MVAQDQYSFICYLVYFESHKAVVSDNERDSLIVVVHNPLDLVGALSLIAEKNYRSSFILSSSLSVLPEKA